MNIYVAREGKQYGPYPEDQVRAMLASGQLSYQDLGWHEALPSWIPLAQIIPAPTTLASPASPDLGQSPYASQQTYPPAYTPTQTAYPPGPAYYSPYPVQSREYASFWLRFCAAFLDGIIMNIITFPIGLIIGIIAGIGGGGENAASGIGFVVGILASWLYTACMESSKTQATLGKMACGIIVTDLNGDRISFGRATGRYFAKMLSGCLLLFGYLMYFFSDKKQTLHDQLAGTLVYKK